MNLFIRQNKEDLLKMYPDKKESDYFLWIITDYFTRFKLNKETDNATVRIVINNKPIDYYEGKIRTPYPNKGICQYSMKNGRKTCYGFPLKFNSLKELMNVHTINIEWEIEIENTIITTSIKYDIDISDWNNINNQILDIHHQISVLMESNAMIHTCNYFDDVYLFNPKEWVKDNADITCSEGLEFLKCTNEDMYNDYDLEKPYTIFLGRAGSGKTFRGIAPKLLKSKGSIIVNDYNCELLQKCGVELIQKGYKIKILDLCKLSQSNHYNPFQYIYDEDGRIKETYVYDLAKCVCECFDKYPQKQQKKNYINNDLYFRQSEIILLRSVIYYVAEKYKKEPLKKNC